MYRKKGEKMEKNLDTNMYVYFGSEHYDRELLKNDKNLNIPKFSLIGFSLKSKNGWRKWRDDNDMNSVSKYDYFCFRINNNNLALENIDDIKKLRDMNMYGAIIGKALYDKKLDLKEVIDLC